MIFVAIIVTAIVFWLVLRFKHKRQERENSATLSNSNDAMSLLTPGAARFHRRPRGI